MVFPVVMYICNNWTIRKAEHKRTDAFELQYWRTLLRILWTARKPVNLKGNQSWIFIGRTDGEAKAPIIWPPNANSPLTRKYHDVGKDWRQEEKRAAEDEMVGWHHRFNGHELGRTQGDDEGQGGLVCYSPWGCKELDKT